MMMTIEDVELLRRYATDGSEEAFAELVRRHLGLVYGSALRRVNQNAALAEEVAQGVFTEVARESERLAGKVGGGVTLAGWLYVATRHVAANALRTEVRRVRREQEAFAMHEIENDGADQERAWAQLRPELEAVMDELGAADRDAVLLRFFEGMAFGDVGAALRVSEDAARVRVNRALEKLRGLLAKRGIKSTAAALGGLLATQAAMAAPAGMAASVMGAALAAGSGAAAAVSVGVAGVAGSAGATAAGVNILTFMTTTKLVLSVAGVITALAVGTTVYTYREGQRLVSLERSEKARLSARVEELNKAVKTAEDERTELATKKTVETAVVAKPGPTHLASNATIAAISARYRDPKYVEALQRKNRAEMPFVYGQLYRKLGLTSQQIAAFESALMDMTLNEADIFAASTNQGVPIDSVATMTLLSEAKRQSLEKLKAAIGEKSYNAYQAFKGESSVRDSFGPLFAEAQFGASPFSPEQSDALVALAAKNKTQRKVNGTSFTEYDWDTIVAKAEKSASPAQLALIKSYAEKNKADMELMTVTRSVSSTGAVR